jgi:hypothetical protein
MKKRFSIAGGTVAVVVVIAAVRVFSVVSLLNAKQEAIKQALRAAPAGTLRSNADDGADRFIKTGELILEPAYLFHPNRIEERSMLNMRLSPRVTTDSRDGWVGKYQGHWYVKIF